MATKYRRMSTTAISQMAGQWEEFDDDPALYERSPGGFKGHMERLLMTGEPQAIQVYRNGGWRDVPGQLDSGWERATTVQVDRLESQASGARGQAALRREKGEGLVETARAALQRAEDGLRAAQREAEKREAEARRFEAEASEVEDRIADVRLDLDVRLLARDRREDEDSGKARAEIASAAKG